MSGTTKENRNRRRPAISWKMRQLVFDRTAGHCHICGEVVLVEDFHVDHIVPVRLGGDSSLSNLLAACKDCNHLKSAQRPAKIRDTLRIGIKARRHMKNGTALGDKLWRSLGVESQLEATPRNMAKLRASKAPTLQS